MDAKKRIIRDFSQKRDSYFERNYGGSRQRSFLRKYRNELIRTTLADIPKRCTVLDAGCGPAILYPDLFAGCESWYALDLAPSNLERIRETTSDSRIRYLEVDLDSFRFQENYFDVIICSGSLEYNYRPADNLIKLVRMLRPNGILVASFPNLTSPYRLWAKYVYNPVSDVRNRVFSKPSITYPHKLFRASALRRLLWSENSPTSVRFTYFGYKLLLQPLDTLFPNLDFRIASTFQKTGNPILGGLCSEFLLTVRV